MNPDSYIHRFRSVFTDCYGENVPARFPEPTRARHDGLTFQDIVASRRLISQAQADELWAWYMLPSAA